MHAAIRRMQLLQIDTISVVARSPYLVLFTRVGAYDPAVLEQLLARGRLFEYWTHAMCFIPAEDFALIHSLIARKMRGGSDRERVEQWLKSHPKPVEHVRQRLRDEGPLRSADFENEAHVSGGWWDWKAEKIALEYMFYTGELMVARRERFQRVYDFTERVMPQWDAADALEPGAVYQQFVASSALALGVATEPWLRDYYRLRREVCQPAIDALLDSGELVQARLEGQRAPAYIHRDRLKLLRGIQSSRRRRTARTTLLSPFDPVVWDRARGRALFGFDYTIEVYTPAAKRTYGYYVLPLLHGGRLIGRVDPKAHRKDGIFELRAVHLEDGVKPTAEDWEAVAASIQRMADWHSTPQVRVTGAGTAARGLKRALKG